jgi:hypothetical protein
MSKGKIAILAALAIVGTACWFCSEALWNALGVRPHSKTTQAIDTLRIKGLIRHVTGV